MEDFGNDIAGDHTARQFQEPLCDMKNWCRGTNLIICDPYGVIISLQQPSDEILLITEQPSHPTDANPTGGSQSIMLTLCL